LGADVVCRISERMDEGSDYDGLIFKVAEEGAKKYRRVGVAQDIPVEWLKEAEVLEIVIV
jgi:hypothetical protein